MSRNARLRRTMAICWAAFYGVALLVASCNATPDDLWVWPFRAATVAVTVYTIGKRL